MYTVYECLSLSLHPPDSNVIWRWNENIVFDLDIRDLPRGARLCLGIYAVYGRTKGKKKAARDQRGVRGT